MKTSEHKRLEENYSGKKNWLRWGPYLSERQWGTVREDYSANGNAWAYFPHDHARSRAYRWGEDGIAGICDAFCNLCFSVGLWNGQDSIIKERLFGLTGPEGNHGEDVKELYYYLDCTPSHSYMKHLYKYPQAAFPYEDLVKTNGARSKGDPEYELLDTGVFAENRYFDVFTEYAKVDSDDILIRITVCNRSSERANLTLLPTLWFRNLWSFGLIGERPTLKELTAHQDIHSVLAEHEKLGQYYFYCESAERVLFTENDTNLKRIRGVPNESPYVKDSINDAVIQDNLDFLSDNKVGTKCSPLYHLNIDANGSTCVRLRLSAKEMSSPFDDTFDKIFAERIAEADEFYSTLAPLDTSADLKNIQRQALAGMLWTKQYYNINIARWLKGDPGQPQPPESRKSGRNKSWLTLKNEDIISMPDKWEYPWYAAWDLAFHCIPLAMVDVNYAKEQLILFLREWYMHPNGQLPAYEWSFSDVNPPVHAWACMRVYRIEKERTGQGDIDFLKRVFQKLLINFTWWVNRKDHNSNNVFEGGFLGLDNIGLFDRSAGVPGGGHLEQADGTSWMATYSLNMLDMALEICQTDRTFEDVATKFLEHFVYIAEALNRICDVWTGAWDEEEGFFYDILARPNGEYIPLKVRSLVGLTSLFATLVLDKERLDNAPDFNRRLKKFADYRRANNQFPTLDEFAAGDNILLSLTPRKRIAKLFRALLDENEFLSLGGIRSLSKIHETPYVTTIDGHTFGIKYEPGESSNRMFGGNSNWRGPVWIPMNYILIESIRELYKYAGNSVTVAFPAGSDNQITLTDLADELSKRLISLFTADADGRRPIHGNDAIYQNDPHFKNLILFYEYFHGDNGRGVGASHQTGWSGLVAELIQRGCGRV